MKWANFLHIYQPAGQQPDILAAVAGQSYRPILQGIRAHKKVRLTLNINGALLELFDQPAYRDLLDLIGALLAEGRLELTGSAKYHALLPLLEEKEIVRQVEINNETLRFYFKNYRPAGFFPPEMAYDERLPKILEELGFKWLILDEIAKSGQMETVDYHKLYQIQDTRLLVYFRERRSSNLVMSAIVRSYESLKSAMHKDFQDDRYLITGMDGETFGHHRPGLEKLLFEMFDAADFDLVQISDLPKSYPQIETVVPVRSTWASSQDDIERDVQFLSWQDPQNEIHAWQWELVNLAIEAVHQLSPDQSTYPDLRARLDAALASDHFWWASAKPWWSLEMIELGAFRCLSLLRRVPEIDQKILDRAGELYENIVSTAFEWQRSGKIRQMAKELTKMNQIPFKDRTWGLGDVGGARYRAFLDMMRGLEKAATKKGEYEQAILWRDAIWRLEHKTDVYEAINAIDLLRTAISNEQVEKILDKYVAQYRKIRGGQPEQRG